MAHITNWPGSVCEACMRQLDNDRAALMTYHGERIKARGCRLVLLQISFSLSHYQ
jgi:hypothetical protein